MKLTAPYKCDYCGKLKEASNHWFLRSVFPIDSDIFSLFGWDERSAAEAAVEHVCGQDCATKALAKWMAAQ
jgi:hypothetical protein